jgi:hypothetical protein
MLCRLPACELAAPIRAREAEPDEPDFAIDQHPGHQPQTRLVVLYYLPDFWGFCNSFRFFIYQGGIF